MDTGILRTGCFGSANSQPPHSFSNPRLEYGPILQLAWYAAASVVEGRRSFERARPYGPQVHLDWRTALNTFTGDGSRVALGVWCESIGPSQLGRQREIGHGPNANRPTPRLFLVGECSQDSGQ